MSFCFLKENSLWLGISYKTKDVFISWVYYYYCEKPAWDVESHSLHGKLSDFAPFVVHTWGSSSYYPYWLLQQTSERTKPQRYIRSHHWHMSYFFKIAQQKGKKLCNISIKEEKITPINAKASFFKALNT